MTDNRTTELLRKGLTDRGIKWRSGLEGVTFVGDWCFVEYDNGRLAATCEAALTPEQAIAATLGSGTCEYKPMWNDDDLLTGEYVGMWYTGCGDALVWNADNDECCKPPAFCPYCGGAVKVVSA